MLRLILASLALVIACVARAQEPANPASQRAILVTGASTGIGRAITERLAAQGHFVFAGARKPADLAALARIENVHPVRLDVTDQADIDAARKLVEASGRGLYALVNNAGVTTLGPVVALPQSEFDLIMSVNAAGPWRVTKAFAPLVAASRGRITTIGSISGILAGENNSAYSMSKHAVEAFTDALAAEMQGAGVRVSLIEPGNYNTPIARKAAERIGPGLDPRFARLADRSRYKEPDEVAATVLRALFEPDPKLRYLIVPEEREAERTIRRQILRLVQLNEGHAYTFDRAALIAMLDEELAKAKPRTAGQP